MAKNIMHRIKKSQCFVVVTDETTDVTGIEQFSSVIYAGKIDMNITYEKASYVS